jgi:chaperone modulatory protein CbpM
MRSRPTRRTRTSSAAVAVRYPLLPAARFGLEELARRTGHHPDLLRRFVRLGLLDVTRDAAGRLWFGADAPSRVARVERLRGGLGLNYAAIGVVLDLLDRIDLLESALRRAGVDRPPGDVPLAQARNDVPWT